MVSVFYVLCINDIQLFLSLIYNFFNALMIKYITVMRQQKIFDVIEIIDVAAANEFEVITKVHQTLPSH